MSTQATAWAIQVKGLPIATKAVLMILGERHNLETGQCNPSIAWLQDITGLKERALQMHIRALEQAGLIVRAYTHHGRGKGCSVQYNLKIGILGALKSDKLQVQENAPAKSCARKITSMRPQNLAGTKRVLSLTNNYSTPEPEENLLSDFKSDAPEPPLPKPEDLSGPCLETIWAKWSAKGRERSKSKALIRDQLRRLSASHDLRDIAKAALRYARETDPAYHKALDLWLKDRRFENFLPEQKPAKPLAKLALPEAEALTPIEHAFRSFADFGEWTGDRIGHPLKPDHPDADYPADLYARFGMTREPKEAAA